MWGFFKLKTKGLGCGDNRAGKVLAGCRRTEFHAQHSCEKQVMMVHACNPSTAGQRRLDPRGDLDSMPVLIGDTSPREGPAFKNKVISS